MNLSGPIGAPIAARSDAPWASRLAAAAVAGGLLTVIQLKVARPMLLAERFLPGAGWVELALLAAYAGWLAGKMQDERESATWRRRVWLLFSAVFFGQLALGLAGIERCLMTGKLHLPIPALIVGGPLYRGEGFFMPTLFLTTLLIVGPAWCSHLCYIGSWDLALSRRQRRPELLPRWRGAARAGFLALVVVGALGLRLLGAGPGVALVAGAAFGLAGVAVMVLFSRRTGAMVHCTVYCPIGLLATTIGKLSPFRMRIAAGCSRCNACSRACRYDALRPEHIAKSRPGWSCTLCGDCVAACHARAIEYRFLGLPARRARAVFIVLVAALHAVFLGVARI
ncbi:MAG: 4Fe-4S binding protein [Myxococcales bacterium]|jgi:polyferredoxin